MFNKYFGDTAIGVRNAIAHSGGAPRKKLKGNAFSGNYKGDGIEITNSKNISLRMGGEKMTMTFGNHIVTLEVTRTKLAQLVEVRDAAWKTFERAARELHGVDLGD